MKRTTAVLVLLVAVTACNRVKSSAPETGAADELTTLASSGSKATYEATYRYTTTGLVTPGITTRMQIVSKPPLSIRKLETSTTAANGRAVTIRSWQATNAQGSFSCAEYTDVGVRCATNALPPATFQSAQLDEFFDAPRRPGVFGTVARAAARPRIAGQVATCFQAQTAASSPEKLSYELCYSSDGILLRGRRSIAGPVGSGGDSRREAIVEAVALTRNVVAADIRLPGPVTDPQNLRR